MPAAAKTCGKGPPDHAIVQVVEEVRLADAGEAAVGQRRANEDLARRERVTRLRTVTRAHLVHHELLRLADRPCRQQQARGDVDDAEVDDELVDNCSTRPCACDTRRGASLFIAYPP
jgi:hypothetical protein